MGELAAPAFDPANAEHIAAYDELPLWSAQAGLLLLDHIPLRATRVLDLGCGAGFPALELAERMGRGAQIVGLDPWEAALRRAHMKQHVWLVPHALLVRGDGVQIPFRDGAFQLVVSNLGINNFSDPDGVLHEVGRVLTRDGSLAFTTNREGHFAEFYEIMADVLEASADPAALERLRAHVAHRGTIASLTERLNRCGFHVDSVHERTVIMRFADGGAVFDHHFLRLGFVPAWRDVAGENADAVLNEVRRRLDARAGAMGELRLTVPLVVMIARPALAGR
ncbi:MAG TPA: class I SAM-dependent methyltransferase [Candidatus Limnocylindria bacterium]|nr:class I SAM-dependent methyltransferase [Candidatus Limnocylindria bacterium]